MSRLPLAFTFAAMLIAGPASAQFIDSETTCGARETVTERLEVRFGEIQQGTGLVSTNRILELWRSKDGTWTILMTRPDGKTCILAAGQGWDEKNAVPGDPT